VSELKARGEQVIVIAVSNSTSANDLQEIENTVRVIEGYNSISKLRNSSVAVHYVSNVGGRMLGDKQVFKALSLIKLLYSGSNRELDSADLRTWLNFPTTSAPEPTITSLTFPASREEAQKIEKIISLVALTTPTVDSTVNPRPLFYKPGFITEELDNTNAPFTLVKDEPIMFALSFDLLSKEYRVLKEEIQRSKTETAAALASNAVFDSGIKANGNGLVF
jgi:hypothetical protein